MNAPDKTVEVSQAARELEPCPFCGGEAKTFGPYGWYSQWGISHSCKTFYNGSSEICQGFGSANAAIAAWNTRATQPEAALREADAALKPFADVADEYDDADDDHHEVWMDAGPQRLIRASFKLEHYRRARAARAALKDHRHG